MGPAEAKLNQDLQIRQVVSDLAACWRDSEKNVLEFLAKLTLDGKLTLYTKVRVTVPDHYVKGIDPITQEQIDTPELATTRRTIYISAAESETRLRRAARDGWHAVKPVRDGEREFEFGTLMVSKDKLIAALESERFSIPPKWIGGQDADDLAQKPNARPLMQQRHQEQEILRVIRELEHTANALPKWQYGKKGVKAQVRARLNFSSGVFNKAWARLRSEGKIQDAG